MGVIHVHVINQTWGQINTKYYNTFYKNNTCIHAHAKIIFSSSIGTRIFVLHPPYLFD